MLMAGLGLLAALFAGAVAAQSPKLALAVIGAIVIVTVALRWPAQHLILTLVVATLVPYDLQHRFSAGGLVLVDAMVVLAMVAGGLALARERVDRRALLVVGLVVAFLALLALQAVRSWRAGQAPGDVLLEFRQTFALGTVVLAVPMLADAELRPVVLRGLLVGALALCLIGFAEWALHLAANSSEDFGVSNGAQLSATGAGKLLGGRYVYPAIVVVAFAVLSSPAPRSRAANAALTAVLLLGAIDVILTLERAFWLATAFGLLLVVVRSGRAQRARALLYGGMGVLLVTGMMSVVAPSSFGALRERLVSVGQYRTDTSVTYRLVESRYVLSRIRDAPLAGSGLGASVYWGIPSLGIAPKDKTYSHNAYLRLAWKIGIPLALLLTALLASLVLIRRGADPPDTLGLRIGAQAALVALFIMAITGPIFSTLSAMAVIGLLAAMILVPAGPARG